MTTNAQASTRVRALEACAFVACILIVGICTSSLVVWASPVYQDPTINEPAPLWQSMAETALRVALIAAPFAIVFLLPLYIWLVKRLRSASLVVLCLALASAGLGLVVFVLGVATRGDLVFAAMYLLIGGTLTAVTGATLFYVLRRVPVVPISVAAGLLLLSLAGAFIR